jgi:5-methylcytosine-specific restriction protein A
MVVVKSISRFGKPGGFFFGYCTLQKLTGGGRLEALDVDIHNKEDVGRWVRQLIDEDRLHEFYVLAAWLNLRDEVLAEHKHECQNCKRRGKYVKAVIVHHVRHLRDFPELALSKTYIDRDGKEQMQLKPVCRECHEYVEHPERLRWNAKKPLTKERW